MQSRSEASDQSARKKDDSERRYSQRKEWIEVLFITFLICHSLPDRLKQSNLVLQPQITGRAQSEMISLIFLTESQKKQILLKMNPDQDSVCWK
jgi:nitrate reductase NapE component